MSGTVSGGQKARKTNIKKYGKNFYRVIGSRGGQVKTNKPKGFAANPALARIAGAKGGRVSKRTGVSTGQGKEKEYVYKGGLENALVFKKEK